MKTQISNLINGSENTVRNLSASKYAANSVGFHNKPNVPVNGGTPTAERNEIALRVAAENPGSLHIRANGVELSLTRHNSTSGKSWRWEAEITSAQYASITGSEAPVWSHKGARNSYGITVNMDCTVAVYATSGKKDCNVILGEEFIEIL